MKNNSFTKMYRRHLAKTPGRASLLNHVLNVIRLGVWAGTSTNEIMRDLHAHGVAIPHDNSLDADLRATISGMRAQKHYDDRKLRNEF